MEKLQDKLQVSFSTKVLVPVVSLMVLLLAITVWMVNRRLTLQFEVEAARNLATADGEFQNAQKSRTKNLVQRFRNLRNEPRYTASVPFQVLQPPTPIGGKDANGVVLNSSFVTAIMILIPAQKSSASV